MMMLRKGWIGAMIIHTYIHTYIQTGAYTYIHTYIHTYLPGWDLEQKR